MTLSIEWTLENRPTPLQVRVTAEVRHRWGLRSGDALEIDGTSACDTEGRPVRLTPEEEREAETALLSDAPDADSLVWEDP